MPPDFILRREEADVSVQELHRYGTLTILVELGPKRYIRLLNASVFEPFWIQPQIQLTLFDTIVYGGRRRVLRKHEWTCY